MENRFIRMSDNEDNTLCHFGTIGMKWGKRNPVGPDGRIVGSKFSKRSSWVDRNLSEKVSGDPKKRKMSVAEYNIKQGQNAVDAVNDIVKTHADKESRKTAAALRTKAKTMDEQQLKEEINRMSMEQQYSRLKAADLDSGKARTSDILATVGDVLAIGGSAATIATAFYMMKQATKEE